jgi:hypothetical protein
MKRFKVTLYIGVTGENVVMPEQVKNLIYEQWDQTPAFGEGDRIFIESVEEA